MTRFQLFAIAAPIVFVSTAASRSTAAQGSGLRYTFVTQGHVTDPDGKTTDGITMSGHASILGDRTRIDFDSLSGRMAGMRGGYFLVLNGGDRVVVVVAKAKRYLEMPMQVLAQHFTKLTTGADGFVDRRHATDVHVDAVAMGDGPTLFGHATTHYRLVDTKTINSVEHTERDSIVNDMYYAVDLKNFVNPFLSYVPAMVAGMGMYGPAYDQQYMAARAKLYQRGAPLRTVSDFTITVDNGTSRMILTTEVTQLNVADVDASVFDLPADYARQTIGLPH